MTDSLATQPSEATTRRALLFGLLLIVLDAFCLNQGVISALIAVGLVVLGLPRALYRTLPRVRNHRLQNLAIYAASVTCVFALNAANNHIAATRAATIVSAVKAFATKYGHYPATLTELVPDFLERIPVAKYTLIQNNFDYHVTDGRAFLLYVQFPPFGRPVYRFSDDKWGYLD